MRGLRSACPGRLVPTCQPQGHPRVTACVLRAAPHAPWRFSMADSCFLAAPPFRGPPSPSPLAAVSLPSVPLSSLQPPLEAASASAGDERMRKRCGAHTAEYYAAMKKGAILPCVMTWKSLCTTPGLISTSPCSCSGVPGRPSEFNLRESAGCSPRCGGWNVGGKHISGEAESSWPPPRSRPPRASSAHDGSSGFSPRVGGHAAVRLCCVTFFKGTKGAPSGHRALAARPPGERGLQVAPLPEPGESPEQTPAVQ